jgi:DNA invertase Pin-like site-specific DNA recombinase
MKLAGYLRVSRVGGRSGARFLSPTEQRQRIEGWAQAAGHTIGQIHEDLDQPGSKAERPGLIAAMGQVKSGAAEGIVVAKLDRFGRSVLHQAQLLRELQEAGGQLFTVAEGIDTGGATGNLIATILGAIAEWELERIRTQWQSAQSSALERGIHVSGHTPAGYRRDDDGRLEPDPDVAPAIRAIFEQRADGASWSALVRMLADRGIPTGRGSPRWTIQSLQALVKNRVYLGEAKGGGMVKLDAHEPLVDHATWTAANRSLPSPQGETGDYTGILSGILRCAGCSYALQIRYGSSHGKKARRQYRCIARKAGGICPAPASVTAHLAEAAVLERFWSEVEGARGRGQSRTKCRRDAEAQVARARGEFDAALDQRLAEALGGPEADVYLEVVAKRRTALEDAEATLAGVDDPEALPDVITLREIWDDLELDEQRRLVRRVFAAVFLRRSRRSGETPIERLRFFEPDELPPLPARGARGKIRSVEVD